MILIISLGAVVRMIAPILKDKKTDPGVVVIDDKGENVISVLSGHLGGANELTKEVAAALDARANNHDGFRCTKNDSCRLIWLALSAGFGILQKN